MKIVNLRRAAAAMLAAAGLLWSPHTTFGQMNHFVGDASFEEIALGTLDYYYVQGPPNSPFWVDHPLSTGKNAVYNTVYATETEPDAPNPRTGEQAIDGEGAYNYQILDDVFVAGRTYTYTAYIQAWASSTQDIAERFWMYLFAGDAAPGDGAPGTMDGSSLLRATWHQNGTIDNVFGVGAGAHSFLPFSGFNRSGESEWTQVGMSYTATAADAGKRMGLGFWANELGAVDDIALTSIASLPADYDRNGSVGPEDYIEWRNTFGQTVSAGDGADGNGDTLIDAADYVVWRKYSGQGSGAAGGVSTPEPATGVLCVAAAIATLVAGRRRHSSDFRFDPLQVCPVDRTAVATLKSAVESPLPEFYRS